MKERKLIRLAGFDYTSSRYYFFTICVKDHTNTFGKIENRSMQLSCNGYIAIEQWYWLGRQYPYIDLIAFVIMPDHIHGIIHINADYYNNCVGNGRDRSLHHIIIYVKYSYSQKNNKDYCIYKK
jgi:REP element-mobilizing transposase RayT